MYMSVISLISVYLVYMVSMGGGVGCLFTTVSCSGLHIYVPRRVLCRSLNLDVIVGCLLGLT